MNTEPRNHETDVLQRVLAEVNYRADKVSHLDDETLALFAAGALSGAERDAAIEHLANCDHCREVVASLMQADEEVTFVQPQRKAAWFSPQVLAYALAACLLIGVTGFLVLPGLMNRAGGPPVAVNPPVGPNDPGRTNPARPPLEMVAFASHGRLTDYGFGLDGRPSTQFEITKDIVPLPEGQDIESLLKKGHLLLSQGHAKMASETFAEATEKFPKEPVAWLGAGLAAFVDRKPDVAEKNFRKALELNPQLQSARVNLAITLEAKDDKSAALKEWKAVLTQELSPADKEKIETRVKDLEQGTSEK